MPDQTYLQQAQPSTFGHYVLSFVYPAVRDARRLLDEFDDLNRSPAGAGCVSRTRLLDDRTYVAAALGFDEVIEHTRDAMWQIDGLIPCWPRPACCPRRASLPRISRSGRATSSTSLLSPTATPVEHPHAAEAQPLLAVHRARCVRVLIGRLTGFLAVAKGPSARSDNDLRLRGGAASAGLSVIQVDDRGGGHLQVNVERMAHALDDGYTQATDLSEFIVQTCKHRLSQRVRVVGWAVRKASSEAFPADTSRERCWTRQRSP